MIRCKPVLSCYKYLLMFGSGAGMAIGLIIFLDAPPLSENFFNSPYLFQFFIIGLYVPVHVVVMNDVERELSLMVAGCGNKCVKYIFWAINFLLFALGVVVLAFAIWMRVDSSMMVKLVNQGNINISDLPMDTIYYILYGIMVIGAVLLILGFLGCCGSACESLCAIGLYFLFVIIIFVVKIVAIIMYFVKKDSIREYVTYVLREFGVRNYSTQQTYRNIMDQLQRGLFCCGAYSCNDWATYGQAIPTTCPNCAYGPPGCGAKFWSVLEGNLLIVLVICFAILVIELLAMILACVMCGAVKDKRNQSY